MQNGRLDVDGSYKAPDNTTTRARTVGQSNREKEDATAPISTLEQSLKNLGARPQKWEIGIDRDRDRAGSTGANQGVSQVSPLTALSPGQDAVRTVLLALARNLRGTSACA